MKSKIWIITIVLMVIGFVIQVMGLFSQPADVTVSISYFICLLISAVFLLWFRKRKSAPRSAKNPALRFILFGSIAAAVVEIIFWSAEMAVGSSGVAAHPNVIVDLAVTMPWYIPMVTVFYFVNKKCGFSYKTAIILGGVYEFAADGIAGPILMGTPITPIYLLQLVLFSGTFFVVYFPMLAMPMMYYKIAPKEKSAVTGAKRLLMALLPILILIPFTLIFLSIF